MTIESDKRSLIKSEEFILSNHQLGIETGSDGAMIPIIERLADPSHYTGPSEFNNVVNLRDLIVNSGMRASRVNDAEMWSKSNLPPKGIRILEFEDPDVKNMTQKISEIASTCSNSDIDACNKYYALVKRVFGKMQNVTGVNPKSTVFLGLLRAGGVAGKMLDIPLEKQVLIETKRLRLKEGDGGYVSIGINYLKQSDFEKMNGKYWLIADPAGATFASVIANLVLATRLGVRPEKVSIWNTVASHKGALFALDAMNQLGIDGEIITGGYSPGMNDKYYLETPDGKPSVGDAGDWLNTFL